MLSLLELQMSHVSDFKMPLCICICLTGKLFCKHFQKKKVEFLKGWECSISNNQRNWRQYGDQLWPSCRHFEDQRNHQQKKSIQACSGLGKFSAESGFNQLVQESGKEHGISTEIPFTIDTKETTILSDKRRAYYCFLEAIQLLYQICFHQVLIVIIVIVIVIVIF